MKRASVDGTRGLRNSRRNPSAVPRRQKVAPPTSRRRWQDAVDRTAIGSATSSRTDPDVGVRAIREFYEEHGYVWLKGFLPRNDVIEFRGWVFSHMADAGLIEPGSDPALGIASPGAIDKNLADRRLMSYRPFDRI